MDIIEAHLHVDPAAVSFQIEQFLRLKLAELKRHGVLVGLSGGLDSSIVAILSVRAIGRKRVRLLYLPDRDSRPVHAGHAEIVARQLQIPLEKRELTAMLDAIGIYQLLPISLLPGRGPRELAARLGKRLLGFKRDAPILEARLSPQPGSYVARGNAYGMAKHRLRMLLLYQKAEVSNLMVVGAANKTELLTGTFSQWGCDQCADVMPIIHLYRSQLHSLAEYLGVPAEIRGTPADPDILPGVEDKGALLGSFEQADRILVGLELGIERNELDRCFGEEQVRRIERLYTLSRPMREIPYSLA